MKTYRYLPYVITGGLFFWCVLFFLEISKIYSQNEISGIAAFCEFGIHFFTLIALFQIFFKISNKSKKIWTWLVLSNCCLLIMDISFELSVYFPKNYILSSNELTVFSGFMPYFISLLAFVIFLINTLSGRTFSRVLLIKLVPFFVIFNLVVIFLFLSAIQYDFYYFSWQTISHVVSMTIEFVIFDLALVGLIYSECRGFSILLISIIILMTGDFFVNYSFLSQTSQMLAMGELLWFLGLIGILFSFLVVQKDQHYIIDEWCGERNKIKNKLALWSFGISIISFLIFFILAYCFSAINKQICLGLPLFIMGYSVIVVLASIFVGNIFSAPFKRLEENVQALILEKYDEFEHDFASEEFISLNKFILNAHHIREERDKAKKYLGEIASQVAHDIRSPLMVLKTVLSDLSSLPERQRIDAYNAIQRVTDIANNLLEQYRQETKESVSTAVECTSEPVAIILESIVSEKRIQIKNTNIEINLHFSEKMHNAFIYIDIIGFKRVLSNLINNAIEAYKGEAGIVTIQLRRGDNKVVIDVEDNACGISEEKLNSLLKVGGTFDKKDGSGLGLPYAMNKITEWRGEYLIASKVDNGTKFEITLPEEKPAKWFCSHIDLLKKSTIIILDDDEYIHKIWDIRFARDFLSENELILHHFTDPKEFILFYKNNITENAIFFIDYEMGNDQLTGIDVVRELGIGDYSTLVTSRYEDDDVRKNCQKLKMKIIPKFFTEFIPINIYSLTEIVFIDDEKTITYYWKKSAESNGKSISVFNDPNDFMRIVDHYSKETIIYIDSSLKQSMKGEEFAKILYEKGYCNLILATGYPKSRFSHMMWLKDIVGKEPPWDYPPRELP